MINVGTNKGTKMAKSKPLTANFVKNIAIAGKYYDGGGFGLFLRVDEGGYKRWVQRVRIDGKQSDLGLGAPPLVTLSEARQKALENKRQILSGINPMYSKPKNVKKMLFSEAVQGKFEQRRSEFKSEKHAKQWLASLEQYVLPKLGKIPVEEITKEHILSVLQPIWTTKTPTAKKIQQRIESIIGWAKVMGHYVGENPASWRNNLKELLPNPSRISSVNQFPAIQQKDVSRWWQDLILRDGVGSLALQLLALIGCRSGDIRQMKWSQLDLIDRKSWTIPAKEMKASEFDYVTPLTNQMLTILERIDRDQSTDLVFCNSKGGQLSDMVFSAIMRRIHEADILKGCGGYVDRQSHRPAVPHGLRSTFKVWSAERGFDDNMSEIQLAHSVGSETFRAYHRTDLFERRRDMMEQYSKFITGQEEQ